MNPAYLKAYKNGRLQEIAQELFQGLASCCLCPRRCRVNRLEDKKGFCKTGLRPKVYSFMPHYGEEPPISGIRGSGTIFFCHCNMSCVYCQNYEFSQLGQGGREVQPQELADYMLQLQGMGCHNINLVTPTHVLPQILQSLCLVIPKGLKIPIVYNTGGYELSGIIKLLDGIIDIYLPDMRYADNESAKKYSQAPDYPKYNQGSLSEMQRQVGVVKIDQQGIIERGLIIRHLVLPNDISGTARIMKFIAQELSTDTYISMMAQYFPCYKAGEFNEILRRITKEEYLRAQVAMHDCGLHNGWIQDEHGLDRFAGVNIKPNL